MSPSLPTNHAAAPAFTVVAVTVALVGNLIAQQERVVTAELTNVATLRVELAPYDDSLDSLSQIAATLRSLPPRRVQLPTGGTISAVILAEYGFGPTNLPQTYALLEKAILDLNGIQEPARAEPGPFLIPTLPSRVRPNPAIAWNQFPATAEFAVVARLPGTDMKSARIEDVVTERKVDTTRRGASATTFDLPLPIGLLRDSRVVSLARESFVSIPSEPLRVNFAQDSCKNPNPVPTLSLPQRTQLQDTLKGAKRVVPLYVIDTGWPSEQALAESWDFLRGVLQQVRKQYNLSSSPAQKRPLFAKPSVNHCQIIETALEEYRTLDPTHVRVVYVPMSREQGAAPIISEMIEVADIVKRIISRFGRNNIPQSIPPDILTDAKALAGSVVTRIPAAITGEVTETDKAIVESTILLASEAARLDGSFYTLNESWVVQTDVIRYDQPSNPMGLIVAATGNSGQNITVDEVDFAHRSASNSYFVAVMNVDANGDPVCRSSTIDLSVSATSNVFGFLGTVPGHSATSFAAPRVAWLLAAAEAVRTTEVLPGNWVSDMEIRLRKTRSAAVGNSFRALLADPVKLVSIWK